jgi:hypothetical protein
MLFPLHGVGRLDDTWRIPDTNDVSARANVGSKRSNPPLVWQNADSHPSSEKSTALVAHRQKTADRRFPRAIVLVVDNLDAWDEARKQSHRAGP